MTATAHVPQADPRERCAARRGGPPPKTRQAWASLVVLLLVVTAAALASLGLGSRPLPLTDVLAALLGQDAGDASIIVWGQRVPRTLLGLLVGAALGIGGAVAQSLTRNPLADPGLLGVSAGAALAIVGGSFLFGITTLAPQLLLGGLGAGLAGAAVLALGTRATVAVTPQGLALVGVATASVLVSVSATLVLLDAQTLDEYRFWIVGSLAGRGRSALPVLAPAVLLGAALALLAARTLDALALGDDVARGLGIRLRRARLFAGGAVILLTGAAVAAAGPIGFVGLAVPHAARALAGPRTAWLLAQSAGLGAGLLVTADVVGRVVVRPSELPAGVVTALVGAPVAFLLLRRERIRTREGL
ncbi:MAG: FecCD family ABC transporter permease [Actinomycetota bacterium]